MQEPNQKRGLVPFHIFPFPETLSKSQGQDECPGKRYPIPPQDWRIKVTASTLPKRHSHVILLSPRAVSEYLNVILKKSTTPNVSRSPMLPWKAIKLNCQLCHAYKCLTLFLTRQHFRLSLYELYHPSLQIITSNFDLLPFTSLFLYCKSTNYMLRLIHNL